MRTPEYIGILSLLWVSIIIVNVLLLTNIRDSNVDYSIHIEDNGEIWTNDPDFIELEFCSLTDIEPFYDCSEQWQIFYKPTLEYFYHKDDPDTHIAGKAVKNIENGRSTILLSGYQNYTDTCEQTVLEHEIRHLKDENWEHEPDECTLDLITVINLEVN